MSGRQDNEGTSRACRFLTADEVTRMLQEDFTEPCYCDSDDDLSAEELDDW